MNTQNNNRFLLGRRSFILTAFICTLLINRLMVKNKNEEISTLSTNKDEGFVILDGWVLLNEDLIENLG